MAAKIKITFLGTSDAIPSDSRNHSAILLEYNGENILFDCGEGTQRQFRKVKLNPCKITRILISHWHGDHVLGLPGLLSTLSLSGYNQTMHIYGPVGTKTFVKEMLKTFAFQQNYEIVVEEVSGKFFSGKDFYLEAKEMTHGVPCNAYSFIKENQLRIDKKKLKKSGLPEGPLLSKIKQGKDVEFNGKKFKAKDLTYLDEGKKISFVMDTSLNPKIVSFVKDSDALIIESTFLEDSERGKELASEYKHLTAKQTAEIAKKAKVKKLFLTHISSRYGKNPKLLVDEAKKIFKNSEAVKDFDTFEIK